MNLALLDAPTLILIAFLVLFIFAFCLYVWSRITPQEIEEEIARAQRELERRARVKPTGKS